MNHQLKTKSITALAIFLLFAVTALAQAPQVALRSTDGSTVNLAESKGKIVVLLFGATWAPMAPKELPALQKLADRYAGRSVSFYWVSINSAKAGAKNYATDAELQAFAQKHGLRLKVLRDPDQATYRAFGVDALPTTVILNREGQVHRKHVGFDPEQAEPFGEVIRSLDQLLK